MISMQLSRELIWVCVKVRSVGFRKIVCCPERVPVNTSRHRVHMLEIDFTQASDAAKAGVDRMVDRFLVYFP